MAVTSQSYSYGMSPVLVSALRKVLARTPVEQNYTGTDALDSVERTNKEPVSAAGYFQIPVGQAASGLEDWFEGDDPGSTAGANESTMAQFRRAYVRRPIRVAVTDEWDTGGDVALFRIYTHKMAEAKRALRTAVNAKLVSGTSTAKALQGIPLTIEETPSSSGTYGGLDGATHTFWLNKTASAVGSAQINLETAMETLWRDLHTVGNEPDWWLVSKNVFGFCQTLARSERTFNVTADTSGGTGMEGKLGTTAISFHGKKLVMDATLSDGFAYAMNNRAYKLGTIPAAEWKLGAEARLEGAGQSGYVLYIYWGGQGLCYERAALGQLHGITA